MRFICIDAIDNHVLYEGKSLDQARGFCDGYDGGSRIFMELGSLASNCWMYQMQMVDRDSGTVLARGPIMGLEEASEALFSACITLAPVGVHQPQEGGAK